MCLRQALKEFLPHLRIVSRDDHDGRIFLDRQALISHGLRQRQVCLIEEVSLVGVVRRRQALLEILLDVHHALQGCRCCDQFLIRNVRRLAWLREAEGDCAWGEMAIASAHLRWEQKRTPRRTQKTKLAQRTN